MDSTSTPRGCVLESAELRRLAGRETVNILRCSICWEFYHEPVVLACGHTFCFKCLLEMAKHAKRNNYRLPVHSIHIGCPNCRRPVYIAAILSRKLTYNYALTSIIESLRQKNVVTKVTRETNTAPMEPQKPKGEYTDSGEETKRRKTHHDEKMLDVLTGNVDLMLRTLAANGTVLGDLSCAADIQQIVSEFQTKPESSREESEDQESENSDSLDELHSPVERFFMDENNGQNSYGVASAPLHSMPTEKKRILVQSLFKSTLQEETPPLYHDPAIVSYSLDSPAYAPAENFPPVGLLSFPGFGRN